MIRHLDRSRAQARRSGETPAFRIFPSFAVRQTAVKTPRITDADTRKLADGIVEPAIPAGKYPSGTVCTLWAAIDSDGHIIEVMAGDGPHELFSPCYDALRKWRFRPILEDGQLRPYRANIVFHTP